MHPALDTRSDAGHPPRWQKYPRSSRGSARLSGVDLTAVAAFTAAGLSLANVAISARLASRGQREQWRRDQERPVVARCLTLSDDALSEWWDASVAKQDAEADAPLTRMDSHWDKGRQLLHDLRYEVAQLDLLASRTLRQVAQDLVSAHESETSRLLLLAKPGQGRLTKAGKRTRSRSRNCKVPSWSGRGRTSAWICQHRPGLSWASSLHGPTVAILADRVGVSRAPTRWCLYAYMT